MYFCKLTLLLFICIILAEHWLTTFSGADCGISGADCGIFGMNEGLMEPQS